MGRWPDDLARSSTHRGSQRVSLRPARRCAALIGSLEGIDSLVCTRRIQSIGNRQFEVCCLFCPRTGVTIATFGPLAKDDAHSLSPTLINPHEHPLDLG